jgi:hypothetical protein
MKSYDISVDSDTYVSGDISNRVYYFDFTKLPRGKYAVDWTFQSGSIAGLAGLLANGPICVHMDSWSGAYQYQAGDNTCPTHAVFGALVPNMLSATDGFLGCDLKQNGSITLDTLPFTQYFTIKFRYGMGTTPPASFSRYFMTMELTPLE